MVDKFISLMEIQGPGFRQRSGEEQGALSAAEDLGTGRVEKGVYSRQELRLEPGMSPLRTFGNLVL